MASGQTSRSRSQVRERSQNLAFEAARALAGDPRLADLFRRRPLPEGVTEILQVLADRGSSQIDRGVRVKLEFYVQNVLLFQGASSHRILGVNPGASREDMRTNMRLLMLWLHPDAAGGDAWRTAFAPRVIGAWKDVSIGTGETTKSEIAAVPLKRVAVKSSGGSSRRYGSPLMKAVRYWGPTPHLKRTGARGTGSRRILRKFAIASVIASVAFAASYFFAPLSQQAYSSGFQIIGNLSPW